MAKYFMILLVAWYTVVKAEPPVNSLLPRGTQRARVKPSFIYGAPTGFNGRGVGRQISTYGVAIQEGDGFSGSTTSTKFGAPIQGTFNGAQGGIPTSSYGLPESNGGTYSQDGNNGNSNPGYPNDRSDVYENGDYPSRGSGDEANDGAYSNGRYGGYPSDNIENRNGNGGNSGSHSGASSRNNGRYSIQENDEGYSAKVSSGSY